MLTPFQELRLERGVILMVLLLGCIALGWLLSRANLVLALAYAPIALVLLGRLDAAVIQRFFPLERTRFEVMGILQAFLDGTAADSDWTFFTRLRIADPQLDAIRARLLLEGARGSAERAAVIRACLAELRAGAA